MITNKNNVNRQVIALLPLLAAMAICWIAGCAKKSGREAVPEIRDTLTVTSDTLSKTYDTLLITHDTLPEIPNTLTDKRDGKTYKTVTIGKQTWMAENLNYAMKSGSWCYDNDPSSCNKYGRLYDWKTAMNDAKSSTANPSNVQGVCPSGWHLPSSAEWDALATYVGGSSVAGKKLKSKTGWYNNGNGTDEYGFSALPGGYRLYSDGSFFNAGSRGYWWTATENGSGNAYYRYMGYYDYLDDNNYYKDYGFSVRCVGDTARPLIMR